MNVEAYIEHLKNSPSFMKNVTEWRVLPPREAKYADFPDGLDARLVEALARREMCIRDSPRPCLGRG